MENREPLIDLVERFLARSGMGMHYFGKVAAGNTMLVPRLREGRSVMVETDQRVRRYIADHMPTSEAAE